MAGEKAQNHSASREKLNAWERRDRTGRAREERKKGIGGPLRRVSEGARGRRML